MNDRKQTPGVLLILLAALLWSTNAPVVRLLSIGGLLAAGLRAFIAGIALLPFLRPKKLKFGKELLLTLVCFTGVSAGVTVAIKTTSSAIAVGMQYTSPLWLFLLSLCRGKKPTKKMIVPLAVLSVGVILSMFSRAENVSLSGNLIALSTGLFFAGMTLFAGKAAGDNPIGLSCLSNLFCGIFLLFLARPSPAELIAMPLSDWLLLLYLGTIQVGAAYSCYYAGLRFVRPTTAAMLSPLEMILAPLWTAIFQHEIPDEVGLIGFSLVVAGVILEAVRASGDTAADHPVS